LLILYKLILIFIKNFNMQKKALSLTTLILGLFFMANAQVSITDASFTYLQDFNGLSNTGASNTWTNNSTIAGWYASLSSYGADDGGSNSGNLYSYGTDGETDRALGGINTNAIGTIYYGIRLINNTPNAITSITLSFDGEQWRDANSNDHTLTFDYQIGATVTSLTAGSWTNVAGLTFTSPSSINSGQLTPPQSSNLGTTINLNIPVGQEIMLRWVDDNASANDHGLSIDNFTISSVVLPIQLTSLDCISKPKSNLLTFSTATETNNAHFSIERSSDGRIFTEIGTVRGAGNSTTEQRYTYTDERPLQGINYYRLKQVDFDGQFSYSPVRSVVFGRKGSVTVSPSPASDRVVIVLDEAAAENGDWQVFDAAGRVVQSGAWQAENERLDLDVATFPEGMYTFRLTAGQQTQVKQFRKQ
jgi:Secretion system C-terminal sorting domain